MPTLPIRIATLAALSTTSRASLLMLVVAACNAIDTVIIRIVAEDLHPLEIGFFRNLFSLLLILPWLHRVGPGVFLTSRLSITWRARPSSSRRW
jgi:hypothetical protein